MNFLIKDNKYSSKLFNFKIIKLPKIKYLVLESWQKFNGYKLDENEEFKKSNIEFAEKLSD